MIHLEVDNAVYLEQKKVLEAALSTNPNTQKILQKLIRTALIEARRTVVNSMHKEMKHDPREAARAVRTSVYRKVLGGNINILDGKKRHGVTSYRPLRKGSSGRGGNRRSRNADTERIMSYTGVDRGFILRWVDDGTADRSIKFTSNPRRKVDKWNHNPNTGNRYRIAPYDFFLRYGRAGLERAVERLSQMIDKEFNQMFNNQ